MGVLTQLWEAIPVYTGLSPATFVSLVALLVAIYYLLSTLFAAPKQVQYVPREPPPPPVQLGTISEEELSAYNGTDTTKPLLMAIKGNIYDVSQSRGFYGPGGAYSLFAGKDASRALAKMSFEEEDLTGDISGLGAYEMSALNDWEYKFQSKYHKVGELPKREDSPKAEDAIPSSAAETKAQE
ncbi:unnamed protein product [Calypogeia fissa]